VIYVAAGNTYTTDMPLTGQTSIVGANLAGTGVVFTEPTGGGTASPQWKTLGALVLVTQKGAVGSPTYTLTSPGNPIWTGLPIAFTSTVSVGYSTGPLINGGTSIASSNSTYVGVAVRETAGRIAHFATYLDGSISTWYTDINLVTLLANSLKWAGRCL